MNFKPYLHQDKIPEVIFIPWKNIPEFLWGFFGGGVWRLLDLNIYIYIFLLIDRNFLIYLYDSGYIYMIFGIYLYDF